MRELSLCLKYILHCHKLIHVHDKWKKCEKIVIFASINHINSMYIGLFEKVLISDSKYPPPTPYVPIEESFNEIPLQYMCERIVLSAVNKQRGLYTGV